MLWQKILKAKGEVPSIVWFAYLSGLKKGSPLPTTVAFFTSESIVGVTHQYELYFTWVWTCSCQICL